jgi:hypothetical protein
MGITNDLFPNEIGMGLSDEQLASSDTVADPEDRSAEPSLLRSRSFAT